jgi:hypothetical protein
VVFGAVALSVVMSLVFLFSRGSVYDQIGQTTDLDGDRDHARRSAAANRPTLPRDAPSRSTRVRQMLSARSERLVRKGQPALDIDAEVARLLASGLAAGHARRGARGGGAPAGVARNERRVPPGARAARRRGRGGAHAAEESMSTATAMSTTGQQVGYKRAMSRRRAASSSMSSRIRPGTYFNPQTEVLIVVDDSPEVDHEIFDMDEFDGAEWVLISEDSPLDETARRADRELPGHLPARAARLLGLGEDVDDVDEDDELERRPGASTPSSRLAALELTARRPKRGATTSRRDVFSLRRGSSCKVRCRDCRDACVASAPCAPSI